MKSNLLKALADDQLSSWEMFRKACEGLERVRYKELKVGSDTHFAQINPARIRSSAAKVDPRSISLRPCFLCPHTLPPEQRGILLQRRWLVLLNPYPILSGHLTIPFREHSQQNLRAYLKDFLELSKELREACEVFFNGAKAGASAPDHMHFQAAQKGLLPLTRMEHGVEVLRKSPEFTLSLMERTPRTILRFESHEQQLMEALLERLFTTMDSLRMDPDLLNAIARCSLEDEYTVDIILRSKHRPECYAAQGDECALISPGVIDMAGMAVLVRQEDFEKITPDLWKSVLEEVSLPADKFDQLIDTYLHEL